MARINLLPWREWERERRRTEFIARLGVILVLGAAIVFVVGFMLDTRVESQNQRNKFLTTHISQLDAKITEIRSLRKDREKLLARMRVIQDLQGNRPVIVRVFDELVRTLADGVHYGQLTMEGDDLAVRGTAESNNRISALMRNLDGSDWFAEPNLKSIKEDPVNSDYGDKASSFDLTFAQVNPNEVGEDE
ncbi:MAG: PilN domain-containing protein [Pseudomonadales bacterium]|jgi:type IV pilus assembly protein PilN|nr:PilN domain-containing protein [Pseudomonadales bacterium]MDP6471798.1 PilN domain-containing protein [Pseudomonadales bacterium]MDP6828788.1 PilN domain-containing protein [Pseudomonadales bacterium]MDP6970279.1 PilN domain-containing protein [Pseudomonadales bacterium]